MFISFVIWDRLASLLHSFHLAFPCPNKIDHFEKYDGDRETKWLSLSLRYDNKNLAQINWVNTFESVCPKTCSYLQNVINYVLVTQILFHNYGSDFESWKI